MMPARMPHVDDFDLILHLEVLHLKLLGYADVLDLSREDLTALSADVSALRRTVLRARLLARDAREAEERAQAFLCGIGSEAGCRGTRLDKTEVAADVARSGWLASLYPTPPGTRNGSGAEESSPGGALGRVRELIQRLHAHPDYTPEIGTDLGLLGEAHLLRWVYSSGKEGQFRMETSMGLKL